MLMKQGDLFPVNLYSMDVTEALTWWPFVIAGIKTKDRRQPLHLRMCKQDYPCLMGNFIQYSTPSGAVSHGLHPRKDPSSQRQESKSKFFCYLWKLLWLWLMDKIHSSFWRENNLRFNQSFFHFLLFLPFVLFLLKLPLPQQPKCVCAVLGAITLSSCPPAQFQLNIVYEHFIFLTSFFFFLLARPVFTPDSKSSAGAPAVYLHPACLLSWRPKEAADSLLSTSH